MVMELVGKLPYDHPYRWDGTKFGSGRLWRPSDLGADLALWLDAEDSASITLNSSNVVQWNDKSGGNRHFAQGSGADQPLYSLTGFNGKPAIENVSNDYLASSRNDLGRNVGGLTCAIVGSHPVGATFNPSGYDFFISSGVSNTRFLMTPSVGSNVYAIGGRRLDTDTYATASSSTDALANRGNPWIRIGQRAYSDGVANHWTDGIQDITNALFGTQGAGNTSDTNANISSLFFIGTNGTPSGTKMAEVIVTHSTMTNQDRQKLEGYLAWKWDLVGNLPAAHPYKTQPPFVIDPEAQKYLRAVEAVDGEPLEEGVRLAVNDFVVGCKEDGIWNAIKASAILAGARTLGGALVPLTGGALTNNNFVSADYSRITGLKGNGVNKEISTSIDNTDLPNYQKHIAVYRSEVPGTTSVYADIGMGGVAIGSSQLLKTTTFRYYRVDYKTSAAGISDSTDNIGFWGASRSDATNVTGRYQGSNIAISDPTDTVNAGQFAVFSRFNTSFSQNRISFFSIGESIDLAKLDARVSTLISHITFALNTGLSASDYSAETIAYVNAGYAAGGILA